MRGITRGNHEHTIHKSNNNDRMRDATTFDDGMRNATSYDDKFVLCTYANAGCTDGTCCTYDANE